MKTCFKCGAEKPLDQFYKHPQMADGHVNKCKECNKRDVRNNYKDNIGHYKQYEKERANLPHRVMARKMYSQSDQGKQSQRKAKKKWLKENPIKRAANILVGNAIRDGRLEKPSSCSECGVTKARIHGHHDDYAFPLSVRWLCPGCHTKWHKENGEGKNA